MVTLLALSVTGKVNINGANNPVFKISWPQIQPSPFEPTPGIEYIF